MLCLLCSGWFGFVGCLCLSVIALLFWFGFVLVFKLFGFTDCEVLLFV